MAPTAPTAPICRVRYVQSTASSPPPPPAPPLPKIAASAARAAAGQEGAAAEHEALLALASTHRSVFRVREVVTEGLVLDDLWGSAVFRVRERRNVGVEPGDLFDARLVADVERRPELLLTRTFCFHPREAEEAVRSQIARSRRSHEERTALLFRLLRMRVRCQRYRHVSPARVYLQDDTLTPER
jgi:hypothetical protein